MLADLLMKRMMSCSVSLITKKMTEKGKNQMIRRDQKRQKREKISSKERNSLR